MKLSQYIKRFPLAERTDFALAVGTTIGHLNNVVYGMRVASASLAKQIAMRTERAVAEWDLRPEDWHLIWPELVDAQDAPPISANAEESVIEQHEARDAA